MSKIPNLLALRNVSELKYVNEDNVTRYRAIMRFLYQQYQRLNYWLKLEQVYHGLMTWDLFKSYTLEQCQIDLEQLVEWRNLTSRHDGGRAVTFEEYLRKKSQYLISPYSIGIERLLENLETEEAQEEQGTLRRHIYQLLDYRSLFEFRLEHRKGDQANYTELTDSKFNVLSGGEKAMDIYIPLFAASYSRYSDASADAPKIISLDEAFAGVDDANMRDMFHLLTDMGFDYIMTSQVLWGCYDTVPSLAIYEIYRPKDIDVVTLFHYRWNGERRVLVENSAIIIRSILNWDVAEDVLLTNY